jgi:hypothetical protein
MGLCIKTKLLKGDNDLHLKTKIQKTINPHSVTKSLNFHESALVS